MQGLSLLRVSRFLCLSGCSIKCGGTIRMRATTAAERGGIHSQKVAILTGSTDGIGLDIARRLAQAGASVVISSRKKANVDRAVEELRAENLSVSGIVCHAGKEEDRQSLVAKALEQYGGIDYMISNAAVNHFAGNILDSTAEIWNKIFDVNVTAMFLLAKLSVPHMQKRGGGSIVFTSSVVGYNPLKDIGPYCVSKTALFGLTKVMAKALAPMNIRVNCLAPGLTQTKFGGMMWKDESLRNSLMETNNLQRMGKPNDYGGVVSFMCSPDASYINGETIVVAGGALSKL